MFHLSSQPTVYDAGAKLPAGLLSGNVNNLGNFDQCLAVVEQPSQRDDRTSDDPASVVRGQYCLAYLQPSVPSGEQRPRLRQLHDLVQSHSAFQSDFEDVSIIQLGKYIPYEFSKRISAQQ